MWQYENYNFYGKHSTGSCFTFDVYSSFTKIWYDIDNIFGMIRIKPVAHFALRGNCTQTEIECFVYYLKIIINIIFEKKKKKKITFKLSEKFKTGI